jgi:hypothetical protein
VSGRGTAGDDRAEVVAELDAAAERSRDAFRRSDLDGYMTIFAPDVRFRRADGVVKNLDGIRRDAATHLPRMGRIQIETSRASLAIDGDRAEEVVDQRLRFVLSAFLILHRDVTHRRRTRNVWNRLAAGWRIAEVDVLDESSTQGGVRFGLR